MAMSSSQSNQHCQPDPNQQQSALPRRATSNLSRFSRRITFRVLSFKMTAEANSVSTKPKLITQLVPAYRLEADDLKGYLANRFQGKEVDLESIPKIMLVSGT
jgi:hypothetical protein